MSTDFKEVIIDTYHYTIVELSRLKQFRSDPVWIASVVGISPEEAKAALERLVAIGMLVISNKKLTRSEARFTTKDKTITDSALKHHQRKILEKSIIAMDNIPLELRNQSSMTIAVNPSKIPLAKKMIGKHTMAQATNY